MKTLIISAILLLTATSWANGIERYFADSPSAQNYSWNTILNENMNLKVDETTVVHPVGASLFNVCRYSQTEFKVINPSPKCIFYGYKKVATTKQGGQTKTVQYCTREEVPDEEFVSAVYIKCLNREVISDNKLSGKKRKVKYGCTDEQYAAVPTIQSADVYSIRKNPLFQFSKTYRVPHCEELGL